MKPSKRQLTPQQRDLEFRNNAVAFTAFASGLLSVIFNNDAFGMLCLVSCLYLCCKYPEYPNS